MLRTLLQWYNLRANCIITIYLNNMSTKTKGHTSSKSTSIFSPKNDISIRSDPINALKKIKDGTSSKNAFNADPSKSNKAHNSKSRKNNLKIFSLLDSATLSNPPACEKESKISNAAAELVQNGICNSVNYEKIMTAVTKSDRAMFGVFNYDRYHEDCQAERERLRGFRKWTNTELGQNLKHQYANSSTFTILSYNILAQNLLESHGYLYRKHDPRALSWSHRVHKILEEIISHNAEIICLQEVQEDHLSYLLKFLKPLNYKHIYKKRTLDHTDGSAIFFKTNLFTMLDFKLVEYYRPNSEILNRHNVGIVVKLKLKDARSNSTSSKSDIVVATTHLLYNPKRTDVRLAQIQLMLAELDKMAYVGTDKNGTIQYLPVILTGDFNLKPHTPVYELLTKGVLQYSNLSKKHLNPILEKGEVPQGVKLLPVEVGVNDNCQFVDVVQKRMKTQNTAEANATCSRNLQMRSGLLFHSLNFTSTHYHLIENAKAQASTFQNEWITVDYIFYSNGSSLNNSNEGDRSIGHLNLLARFDLPTVSQCDFMGQIPNLVFGSDHLLLAAKFLFQR